MARRAVEVGILGSLALQLHGTGSSIASRRRKLRPRHIPVPAPFQRFRADSGQSRRQDVVVGGLCPSRCRLPRTLQACNASMAADRTALRAGALTLTCEGEDPSRGGWSGSDGGGGGGGGRPDWGDGHGPNHSHSTDVDGLDCTATRHGALLLSVRCCLLPRHSFSSEPRDLSSSHSEIRTKGVALRCVRYGWQHVGHRPHGRGDTPARPVRASHFMQSAPPHTLSRSLHAK
jgi:hypothetical protein